MPAMSASAGRKVFSVTGVASLPARIRLRAMLVDLLVDRLEEMLRLEEVGDAVERLVVDEDRAQQRLLRLDIVRRDAIAARRVPPPACATVEFESHGLPVFDF